MRVFARARAWLHILKWPRTRRLAMCALVCAPVSEFSRGDLQRAHLGREPEVSVKVFLGKGPRVRVCECVITVAH